jgi:diaminopimelate decarboxylase
VEWWRRDDLRYRGNRLQLGRHDLGRLAETGGTPLFAYHAPRILANLARLRGALVSAGVDARVFYAIKANRFGPVLSLLRTRGRCGVDVCSPRELELARKHGFAEADISYTGTALSDDDARCIGRHPGIQVNCDSLASLRRIARLGGTRQVGLRINPGVGLGYRRNRLVRYSGSTTTKFGIYREQFAEALATAARSRLAVTGLHFHTGCGFLTDQLPALNRVFDAAREFIAQVPGLRYVNLGGGLGVPLTPGDRPLDLAAWSRLVGRHFSGAPFEIWTEPGDYLVKDAGVLLLQVTMVERKRRELFVGVNGGFNLHPGPAFYRLPLQPVPCRRRAGPRRRATIAGNINEALDLLAAPGPLSVPREGDILAFLNAGGYGSAMSSQHCLRGNFREYLLR